MVFTLFNIVSLAFLILILKKRPKNTKLWVAIILTYINLNVLPLSFFIGIMATDSPTSGTKEFIEGFFFIQGLPLLSYLMIPFIKNKKPLEEQTKQEEQTEQEEQPEQTKDLDKNE